MKNILCGDRLGGILFDVQQMAEGKAIQSEPTARNRMIHAIVTLVQGIEFLDEEDEAFDNVIRLGESSNLSPANPNPRIEKCRHHSLDVIAKDSSLWYPLWCLKCGAISTRDGEWRLPENAK